MLIYVKVGSLPGAMMYAHTHPWRNGGKGGRKRKAPVVGEYFAVRHTRPGSKLETVFCREIRRASESRPLYVVDRF